MSTHVEWTAADDEELRAAYAQGLFARHTLAVRTLATRMGITVKRVQHRARRLGLTGQRGRPWTSAEDAKLRTWAGKVSAARMAKQLNRSVTAVQIRLSRLDLKERVEERGYRQYELYELMGITERTFLKLLEIRPMERNRFHNFSRAEVQLWIYDLLEHLELRRFDQEFLKRMLKGAAA